MDERRELVGGVKIDPLGKVKLLRVGILMRAGPVKIAPLGGNQDGERFPLLAFSPSSAEKIRQSLGYGVSVGIGAVRLGHVEGVE